MRIKPKGKRFHHLIKKSNGQVYYQRVDRGQRRRISLGTRSWETAVERRNLIDDESLFDVRKSPIAEWVYFAYCAVLDKVKIGVASNVHQRMKQIAGGMPFELVPFFSVRGNQELESQIHRCLADYRVSGTEWFRAESGVFRLVRKLAMNRVRCPWAISVI